MPSSLEVRTRSRSARLGRFRRIGGVAGAACLVVAWSVWYAVSPVPLDVADRTVEAEGVVGAPVYVGMYAAPKNADRTLHVSGVKVHATANARVEVVPLLCRDGAIGVTTEPDRFCTDLVNPEGQELQPGDSVVLAVTAEESATAVVDRLRIAYRDGFSWATQPAGIKRAVVTIAPRRPA